MKNIMLRLLLSLFAGLLCNHTLISQTVRSEADITNGCLPLTVTYTNYTHENTDTTGMVFRWYFYDTIVESYNAVRTYTKPGRYGGSLEAENCCSYPIPEVEVYGVPDTFRIFPGINACPNEEVNFEPDYSVDYDWVRWEFDDGFSSNWSYTSHSFSTPGDYDVKMIMQSKNDCGMDTAIQTMHISNSALPSLSIYSVGNTFCPNDEVQFGFNSPWEMYDSIEWNFGDGTTSNIHNPTHAFSAGGKTITATVWNSCGNSNFATINLLIDNGIMANANFWIGNNYGNFCPGTINNYNPEGSGNFVWDFGDGNTSTERAPEHSYIDTGMYKVQLIVSNNCLDSDTTTQDVYVGFYPNENEPWVNLRFEDMEESIKSLTVCTNETVNINNDSWNNQGVSYQWIFGDGETANTQNASHSFAAGGTYNVQLIATNNCLADDTAFIEVIVDENHKPTAELQVLQDTICVGERFFFITNDRIFRNGLTATIIYGDGTKDENLNEFNDPYVPAFSHLYTTAGEYDYKFIVTNGCNNHDTIPGTVVVNSSNPTTPFMMVMNSTIEMENPQYSEIPNWGIQNNPTDHKFSIPVNWGAWTPGMEETFFLAIFNEMPENQETLPGGIVRFEGLDTVEAYIPFDYNDSVYIAAVWFCNGILNNEPQAVGMINEKLKLVSSGNTNFEFPGIVLQTQEWWNGDCRDESKCPGDTVVLFAAGGTTYSWDLGDGNIATGPYIKHIYADTGIYNAKVYITNGCGYMDSLNTTVIISDYNTPDIYIDIEKEQFCIGESVIINDHYDNNSFDARNEKFLWNFGDGETSTLENPNHVYTTPGTYEINVTATNGCGSNTEKRTIYIDGPIIDFEANKLTCTQNEDLNFINNTINAINFAWDFGNDSTSTIKEPTISYELFGTYSVSLEAQSLKGCTDKLTKDAYITVLNTPVISDFEIINCKCFGEDNGAIDITITGGVPPYSFSWSNDSITQDISSLSPGSYTVSVIDQNSTEIQQTFVITEPNNIQANLSVNNETCKGSANGQALSTTTGGNGGYTYLWSTGETTADINNLSAGKYYLSITDSKGCYQYDSVVITLTNPELNIDFISFNASCGAADGNINTTVSNGSGSYNFAWNDPGNQAIEDPINLAAGAYTVIVTDLTSGCIDSAQATINDAGGPGLSISIDNLVKCADESNGQITANASGGTPPYVYLWNTGADVATLNNIPSGNYSVLVTDNNGAGCSSSASITLENPTPIVVTINGTNPTCATSFNGEAIALVSGGEKDYTYIWNNFWNKAANINLGAGNHSVTVTDARGCEAIKSIDLVNAPEISIIEDIYNVSVRDSANGTINISVSNGKPGYKYLWSNGATTQDIDNLLAGDYSVTITDAVECSKTFSNIVVNQPDLLNVSIIPSGSLALCNGESVSLSAENGYLAYEWSTGEKVQSISVDTIGKVKLKAISNYSYGYDSVDVFVQYPFENDEICVVSVDPETDKNMIIWEKTENTGIDYYNVYRQQGAVGNYDIIGSVSIDSLTVFVDKTSNPGNRSYFYKISSIDTCGNESEKCFYHKTILLTASIGTSNEVNLNWSDNYEYEGGTFTFSKYEIYRGSDSTKLQLLTEIESNLKGYVDDSQEASQGQYYYRIAGIKSDTCDPAGLLGKKANSGPFSRSLSNLEDNRLQSGNNIVNHNNLNFNVFPNPFSESTQITFSLTENSNVKIEVLNLLGQQLTVLENSELITGQYTYTFNSKKYNNASGIYLIKITANQHQYTQRVIEIQ